MRADIHVLFDLNLIKIDPNDYGIKIDEALRRTPYFKYGGHRLKLPFNAHDYPSLAALSERQRFCVGSANAPSRTRLLARNCSRTLHMGHNDPRLLRVRTPSNRLSTHTLYPRCDSKIALRFEPQRSSNCFAVGTPGR